VELSLFIDRKLNKKIPWMVQPLKRLLTQMLFQILGVLFLIICLALGYMITYLIFGDILNAQSPSIV